MDQAGQKLGLDVDKYKAEFLGVDHDNNPLPGVQTTSEGKPIGTKVGAGAGDKVGKQFQTKGVQARNVQDNLNAAIDLIQENPNLFGKIQGHFTTTANMIGSDDPAIDRLGNIIHNAAMASNSVHGLRGGKAIEDTEAKMLNHFRNSTEATIAGLQDTIDSMGTFTSAATKGAKATIEAPTKKEKKQLRQLPPQVLPMRF